MCLLHYLNRKTTGRLVVFFIGACFNFKTNSKCIQFYKYSNNVLSVIVYSTSRCNLGTYLTVRCFQCIFFLFIQYNPLSVTHTITRADSSKSKWLCSNSCNTHNFHVVMTSLRDWMCRVGKAKSIYSKRPFFLLLAENVGIFH